MKRGQTGFVRGQRRRRQNHSFSRLRGAPGAAASQGESIAAVHGSGAFCVGYFSTTIFEEDYAGPASQDKGLHVESPKLSEAPVQDTGRIDCTPETIEQGLAKLVLSLIELLRQLLERQAIRRMEGGSLSEAQVEEMGKALMTLEEKIHELADHFGLTPAELNLDLGPLGNLLE